MTYVLVNEKLGTYFVRENKYGVCIETEELSEAAKFNSLTLATYKECLLKHSYKIKEI